MRAPPSSLCGGYYTHSPIGLKPNILKQTHYVATLQGAGFADFVVEDRRDALLDMEVGVRRKLLGVELAAKLGKVELGGLDLDEGKRLARRAVEWIESGVVGYALITAN